MTNHIYNNDENLPELNFDLRTSVECGVLTGRINSLRAHIAATVQSFKDTQVKDVDAIREELEKFDTYLADAKEELAHKGGDALKRINPTLLEQLGE